MKYTRRIAPPGTRKFLITRLLLVRSNHSDIPPSTISTVAGNDEIGQVLALTLLLSYDAKREIRMSSLSVSRNNLKIAAFCDLISRFFGVPGRSFVISNCRGSAASHFDSRTRRSPRLRRR